jgi:hypothetical protein
MGYLAQHFATRSPRPTTTGDILSMLSTNRGVATVRIRLADASPQWDGLMYVDSEDASALVAAGLARLEP